MKQPKIDLERIRVCDNQKPGKLFKRYEFGKENDNSIHEIHELDESKELLEVINEPEGIDENLPNLRVTAGDEVKSLSLADLDQDDSDSESGRLVIDTGEKKL